MYTRLLKRPVELGQSFFLFGPRGTGKSTWLRTQFAAADTVFVDLLEGDLYAELLARPQRLEALIPPLHKGWVVLDEIQRVPALLNEVHRLIEGRGLRFAMTGSSARRLRGGGVNLLAGRALTFHMHPLTAIELGPDFSLESSLLHGHLPAVPSSPDPRQYLKSYVRTYLREEVQQEGLARNLAHFARFLEVASFSQGGILNVSAVAREAALDRKVVENYFGILEDLLIAHRLPVFSKRAKRRMVSHPKFYLFDAGVYRAIRPLGPLDAPEEAAGAGLETLCFQELLAVNDTLGLDYQLYYWRTADGTEVDFVLYGERGLLAFEVKRASRVTTADSAGLRALRRVYPVAKCHLLYGGSRAWHEDGISILPIEQALPRLPTILAEG
ncbi:MAG: ATPase [Lentisphaerae bacterium RIFOXYB12_FULL_65_16]|nr:MAG: ATPase [Lentisphaerae bacterium RIFOXYA12_64_32]OGV93709.1 MAG: ATPase [Lentisphaerae bacterium RIFOXYB12_FULL_65_16]